MNKSGIFLFVLILISFHFSSAQISTVDSLKYLLKDAIEDTNKVNILIDISRNEYSSSPVDAILYGHEAQMLSEKLGYQKGLANAFKYIGMGYYFQGEYWETINHWQESLRFFEAINDQVGVANILSNIGAVYFSEGDNTKALEFYLKSLKVAEEINDTLRLVTAQINVGAIYTENPATYDKALDYYFAALPLSEKLGDYDAIGIASVNMGEIYFKREVYDTALAYYEKSLEAFRKVNPLNVSYTLTNIGKIYMKQGDYRKAIDYQMEGYEIAKKCDGKLEMTTALLGLAETYCENTDPASSIATYHRAEKIAEEIGAKEEKKEAYEKLALAYAKISDYDNAYKYQSLLTNINDTLYEVANNKKIQSLQFNFELEKREGQIDLLTIDKELQEAIIQKQKFAKNTFIVGFVVIMLIAAVTYRNFRRKVRINKLLDQQKDEIENLVLNILPSEVAKELQKKGVATPRQYESVSVLFTDFKGFTQIAQGLSPQDLVAELNEFFSAFDEITVRNNLEKIKTIGDAYMCAGGIPLKSTSHPYDAVRAGLEMQEFMNRTNEKRREKGLQEWGLRVGIHTGPVVAGVVGKKKFAYDIWGSSVNIASRMESSGEPGRLNISASTFELVRDKYECKCRGKVYAKNVGDIYMYFVENNHTTQQESLSQEKINIQR